MQVQVQDNAQSLYDSLDKANNEGPPTKNESSDVNLVSRFFFDNNFGKGTKELHKIKEVPQVDILSRTNAITQLNVQQAKVELESSEGCGSSKLVFVHSGFQSHAYGNNHRPDESFELVFVCSNLKTHPEKLMNENASTNLDVSNEAVSNCSQQENSAVPEVTPDYPLENAVEQVDPDPVVEQEVKKEADADIPSDPLPENTTSIRSQEALSAKLALSHDVRISVVRVLLYNIFVVHVCSLLSRLFWYCDIDCSGSVKNFYEEATEESVRLPCSQKESVVRGDTPVASGDESEDSAQSVDRRQNNGSNEGAVGGVVVDDDGVAPFVKSHSHKNLPFLSEDYVNKKPPRVDSWSASTEKESLPSPFLSFPGNFSPPLDDLILDKPPETNPLQAIHVPVHVDASSRYVFVMPEIPNLYRKGLPPQSEICCVQTTLFSEEYRKNVVF